MRAPGLALGALLLAASAASADVSPVQSDLAAEAWPVLPETIASFGAAEAGGWVYVLGGHRGPVHDHAAEHLSPHFLRLSLHDGGRSWELLPAAPALQGLALAAHEGKLIRTGGMSARNRSGQREELYSVADAARYDPAKRAWEPLPPLPEPRSSHDAIVHEGKLWVVGGWSLAGEAAPFLRTSWVLDLAAREPAWAPAPALPEERRALQLAVAGGKLWAVGGMTPEGELSARVDVLDPKTGQWAQAPSLPFHGFGCAAIGVGDDVYASGQESDLWRLRPGAAAWEPVGSLALPRYFHRFVRTKAGLLALGGSSGGVHLRVCETVALQPAGTRAALLDLPAPGRAKNRQALGLRGDSLWLAGGNDGLEQHDFSPPRFLAEAWRLDLGQLRFEAIPPLPEARQTMATVVLVGRRASKDRVVAAGGFFNPGDGARAQTALFALDPRARTWSTLAELPGPRTQLGLVAHEGGLWALGGVDFDSRRPRGESFQFPLDVLRWRPGEKAFTPAGQLPRPRRAFGCAVLDGKVWLVGGMKQSFGLVTEVDVLDLKTGTWSVGPAPAKGRVSPDLVAFRGRLWLSGGSSLPSPDASVSDVVEDRSIEVLDPATGAWQVAVQRLPAPTRHATLMTWRDRLLLYSAHRDDAQAVRLLVLDPAAAPGDRPRRVRERLERDHAALLVERDHLLHEQEAWDEDVAAKPDAWSDAQKDALKEHAQVVADYAKVLERHAGLVKAFDAAAAAEALAKLEADSRECRSEGEKLYQTHEKLEDVILPGS